MRAIWLGILAGLLLSTGLAVAIPPPPPPEPLEPEISVVPEELGQDIEPGEPVDVYVSIENTERSSRTVHLEVALEDTVLTETTRTVPEGETELVEVQPTVDNVSAKTLTATATDEEGTASDEHRLFVGDPAIESLDYQLSTDLEEPQFSEAPSVASLSNVSVFNLEASWEGPLTEDALFDRVDVYVDSEPADPWLGEQTLDSPIVSDGYLVFDPAEYLEGEPGTVTLETTYQNETAVHDVTYVHEDALSIDGPDETETVGFDTPISVLATGPDGQDIDLTHEAAMEVENPTVARVEGDRLVTEQPGVTNLSTSHFGLEAATSIEAVPPDEELEVDVPETMTTGETATYTVAVPGGDEVTESASISVRNESVLEIADGELTAIAPGETEVAVTYEWRSVTTTVQVTEDNGIPVPALVPLLALLLGSLASLYHRRS